MLEPAVVLWIRRLLLEGLTYREVARITGVAQGWIVLIASGLECDVARSCEPGARDSPGQDRPAWRCLMCGLLGRRVCESCWTCWAMASSPRRLPGVNPPDGFQRPLPQSRCYQLGQRDGRSHVRPRWPDRGLAGRHEMGPF
jgi:hypothetical protein